MKEMDIKSLKLVGQGNTAEIYEYEKDKIIKLFRNGITKEIAILEYEKAKFVQVYILNAPRVYDFLQLEDRFGIIYERIYGKDMISEMIKSITKINYYSKKLAHVHMGIHKNIVPYEEKYSLKDKLIYDIDAVEVISKEQKEALKRHIMELPDGESLCHMDFHPGNIMIQDDEAIIIDWMTACVGNPCADVARTIIMLTYGELPNANFFVRKLVMLFQRHVAKVYYSEYLKCKEISKEEVEKWMLPVMAARLREWIPDSEKRVLIALIKKKENCINE